MRPREHLSLCKTYLNSQWTVFVWRDVTRGSHSTGKNTFGLTGSCLQEPPGQTVRWPVFIGVSFWSFLIHRLIAVWSTFKITFDRINHIDPITDQIDALNDHIWSICWSYLINFSSNLIHLLTLFNPLIDQIDPLTGHIWFTYWSHMISTNLTSFSDWSDLSQQFVTSDLPKDITSRFVTESSAPFKTIYESTTCVSLRLTCLNKTQSLWSVRAVEISQFQPGSATGSRDPTVPAWDCCGLWKSTTWGVEARRKCIAFFMNQHLVSLIVETIIIVYDTSRWYVPVFLWHCIAPWFLIYVYQVWHLCPGDIKEVLVCSAAAIRQ